LHEFRRLQMGQQSTRRPFRRGFRISEIVVPCNVWGGGETRGLPTVPPNLTSGSCGNDQPPDLSSASRPLSTHPAKQSPASAYDPSGASISRRIIRQNFHKSLSAKSEPGGLNLSALRIRGRSERCILEGETDFPDPSIAQGWRRMETRQAAFCQRTSHAQCRSCRDRL
jgi:hypothetical protein